MADRDNVPTRDYYNIMTGQGQTKQRAGSEEWTQSMWFPLQATLI